MASGPRPTARPGAGPGRGRTRTRSSQPTTGSKARPAPKAAATEEEPSAPPQRRRGTSITTRAIALVVVLLILTISYANSVRIYYAQTRDIAATRAEIAERQQRIAGLQQQVNQWNDPAYVSAQARDRLGWVKPGETGFTVVDADGNPLGGGTDVSSPIEPPASPAPAWYAKLWGSVEAADRPAPVATKPNQEKPLTEKTKPVTR